MSPLVNNIINACVQLTSLLVFTTDCPFSVRLLHLVRCIARFLGFPSSFFVPVAVTIMFSVWVLLSGFRFIGLLTFASSRLGWPPVRGRLSLFNLV